MSKRPGRRHLAVVQEKADPRLQDSSPDLATALEREAEKYGATVEKFKYVSCKCGMLVRCMHLPETAEFRQHQVTAWAGVCPDCKRQLQLTIVPPQKLVDLAQPGDVPPAPAPA